ncbi:adenosylcobinamide-GDP ribazoletransferase [Synechococcales cyanobacterium C]|uniref:Adenosylcobinamide-GDP ribazoletransferase n=1 Tax=Petrachloros mirabilis ULC683 TaxID=2781853 RepID=A0A8K2A756_9CYAN|nr:adenosylcobinamide-GDP ribazoletransferase [Petrachloros mirabilis]NCJ06531.1 adenosylcobinamide-GDP ribazoletransferase [Petrachloros mirabilis ULC683]
MPSLLSTLTQILRQWGGAIAFYTCIPLPRTWSLDLDRIARWAPWVGLGLGGLLVGMDAIAATLGMPPLTRSALLVALWLGLTGGLHLDGAMDTADGLAVWDPQKRLTVMADSRTGAFGVMAGVLVLLLKTCALTELTDFRTLALLSAMTWGRWGQILAIACYPYLKSQGKGASHKTTQQFPWDFLPGLLALVLLSTISLIGPLWSPYNWKTAIAVILGCSLISWGTGAWFNRQLQGMTGDPYGAVVEWTEAFILCGFTLL